MLTNDHTHTPVVARCTAERRIPHILRKLAWHGGYLIAMLLLITDHAHSEISPALTAQGWTEITFDNYIPNNWDAIPNGVRVQSDGGISIIYRPITVDLDTTPVLTWRWRADAAPIPTDLGQNSGEDRALSLYVAFPYEAEHAGFWEAARRPLVKSLSGLGDATPGRTLTYTWGGDQPVGTIIRPSSRAKYDAIQILRTPQAPVDTWLAEHVDIAAEFEAAFGWSAPNPTHVGLTSDSDDTGQAINAELIEIEFIAR